MLKKLTYSLAITIAAILISYTLAWFVGLQLITSGLKKHYSNQNIDIAEEHFVKFSKIVPAGYPFKIAIKVTGFNEEGKSYKVYYNSPIYVGYDLLKQAFFLSYSGDTIARYKPLQSGFGSKITNDGYLVTIKVPLSLKLLKVIIDKKNWFEVANFFKELEFTSNKIQVYDLVDQSKLYDKDYDFIKISFVKHRYYNSWDDFLNDIPRRLDISYSSRLNSMVTGRIAAPISLLHGAFWPYTLFNGEAKIYLKTNAPNFSKIFDDLEVGITHLESKSDVHSLSLSMLYKNNIVNGNREVALKATSLFELKPGFIDRLFFAMDYIIMYIRNIYPTSDKVKNQVIIGVINKLEHIISNKAKFKFEELENRKYESDIDFYLTNKQGRTHNKINNFSIFSGKTGIRLTNESDLQAWNAQGLTALNNYPKIVDILSNYFYQSDKYKQYPDQDREIYTEAFKYFLKNISDYPQSLSSDITIEYKIDSSNLLKGKVGTVEVDKLKMLYYLSLFRKLAEGGKSRDNLLIKIKKLAPDINDDELNFLEQLIIKPAKVDNNTWQKLIK